jgi:hypothetical protein
MSDLEALDSNNEKNLEEALEAFEWTLFQIKKELREKAHVPKLIDVRIKKLQLLKSTEDLFQPSKAIKKTTFQVSFECIQPLDDFLKFEEKKSNLLQQLDISQSINQVIWVAEDLKNLQLAWAKCWENFSKQNLEEGELKISVQPDSMQLYSEFKELANQKITTYKEFESVQLPSNIQREIKRLQKLSETN